ncbi:unnamed protein product [Vicia faba]|uniref:Uncharacterized protein n=1 Tax=Vicia faba TaxID=3906 RepID=A0AAV1AW07_VICFA|nr:unnamed protein product [Vicia faba]
MRLVSERNELEIHREGRLTVDGADMAVWRRASVRFWIESLDDVRLSPMEFSEDVKYKILEQVFWTVIVQECRADSWTVCAGLHLAILGIFWTTLWTVL